VPCWGPRAAFNGECSHQEIQLHVDALLALEQPIDGLVAMGGGKVVDAGRAIAHRLRVPVQLAQLNLSAENESDLRAVVDATMAFPFIRNMPFAVTADNLLDAILEADRIGRSVAD